MGKTAFSGPVFGSKSLLWSWRADNIPVSTAAQTVAGITVPAGEDWMVTDMMVYRGSTHSTAMVVSLLDDSTVTADVAITSSAAGVSGSTTPTPDGGEYMGKQIAGGSAVTLTVQNGNSSVAASTALAVWVYGYPRWLQTSTNGF